VGESIWHEAVDLITPYIVKISSPIGSGTGFLFAYSGNRATCGIATAGHVVNHPHQWHQPIRMRHFLSGEEVFLKEEDRAIVLDAELDTAAIVLPKPAMPLPEDLIALAPEGMYLKQGVELGWVGFPVVSPQNLCFFSGRISAYLNEDEVYLVDGVAINGVSGGPAFTLNASGGITLAGVISAYVPNRATGEPLPGVCMVTDVSQLQVVVATFKSFDEAKEQEASASLSSPQVEGI